MLYGLLAIFIGGIAILFCEICLAENAGEIGRARSNSAGEEGC